MLEPDALGLWHVSTSLRALMSTHHPQVRMVPQPSMSTCRSTFEHPVCESAVAYADKCCRDEDGNPWPPVPTDVPRDSYTIHELEPSDVLSLDELRLNRGLPFRDCLLYTSPSPRDRTRSRMPSSA